jgi:hypothetical protein
MAAATVGRWIAGHSLFISGQPNAFTPLLAKHFLTVEAVMLPASLALAGSHFVASMALNDAQLSEVSARQGAIIFWTKQFTSDRAELPNVAARIAILTIQVSTFPLWLMVSAWSPASVHECLGTATDLLQQKYVATTKGAPHDFYTPNIDRMTAAKQQHMNNRSLTTDFAAALFVTLFLFISPRSAGKVATAAAPSRE